ncbi:MAG: 2-C-methyl-D-erythritol 4-phosphate cytidylyltransferase [Corynebacterium sp.]|nr:2-C-methyl-D-erythritol 4-phosphate cytidylyltransferase [Corynebacterium sp.]
MASPHVCALVAAAGQGTRLGAELPKAFVDLCGATLLERSVGAIAASRVVDEVIIIVSPDMEGAARKIIADMELEIPVRFVHGCGERADSVWAGLMELRSALSARGTGGVPGARHVVLVHDAARALVPAEMIARVVHEVISGAVAVVPVQPVVDTIKVVNDGHVVSTPERASLRSVQTPQAFQLEALIAANEKYFAHAQQGFVATDDASLMEWCDHTVTTVAGDPMAFKITTPTDLLLAKALLEAQGKDVYY